MQPGSPSSQSGANAIRHCCIHKCILNIEGSFGRCHLTQSLDLDFSRRSFKSLTNINNIAQWNSHSKENERERIRLLSRTLVASFKSVAKCGGSLHCTIHTLTVGQTHYTSLNPRISFSAIRGRNPFNISTKTLHSQNMRQSI